MNPADLLETLSGPQGAAHREQVLAQLADIESRLMLAGERGAPAQQYADLEAALLAVRSGMDTLRRLELAGQVGGASPLVQSPRVISGESS